MRIPMGIGFPWEFSGNLNSFWAPNGNGNNVMGMGIIRVVKKSCFALQHAVTVD